MGVLRRGMTNFGSSIQPAGEGVEWLSDQRKLVAMKKEVEEDDGTKAERRKHDAKCT